jgi:hypothetical protein
VSVHLTVRVNYNREDKLTVSFVIVDHGDHVLEREDVHITFSFEFFDIFKCVENTFQTRRAYAPGS